MVSEPAAIDLRSIRSVKSVSSRKGRRAAIPKAFEIFTDDDCSYVLKVRRIDFSFNGLLIFSISGEGQEKGRGVVPVFADRGGSGAKGKIYDPYVIRQ